MTERELERFETFVRGARTAMLRIAQNLCRASSVDPEDLVEETLERALRQIERRSAHDPLAIPYLATVMTNRYIDLLRRRRAEASSMAGTKSDEEEVSVLDPEPMERWRNVGDEQLRVAVASLRPSRVRAAYELHAQGLRYRAIAQQLGVPEGTVGSDLFDARRQLRRLLGRPS
jgi:RNA polymerase sigma-70 factor (ECF subfamily)